MDCPFCGHGLTVLHSPTGEDSHACPECRRVFLQNREGWTVDDGLATNGGRR